MYPPDDLIMKKNGVRIKKNLIIIFTTGFVFALITTFLWRSDSVSIQNEIENINEVVQLNENESNDESLYVNPPSNDDSSYWQYINMSLLDVNLSELKEINPETVGWIQVLGTNINYPFVQHSDNYYYLDHSFSRKNNGAGWVFLDYRNNIENMDDNTIIYAHGRIDSTLFGTLKNIMNSSWYENEDNHIIRVSTGFHNSLWQVFSVYRINTTSDYIVNNFKNDGTYNNFLKLIKDRSVYDFNVDLDSNDKIITLSTCYSKPERVVMHAKLIKQENIN